MSLIALLSVLPGGCASPRRQRAPGVTPSWSSAEAPSHAAAPSPRAAEADEGIPHAPGRYFRAEAFHEDALAGRHEHGLVQLLDIPVLVIRDEDVFRTPPDRAREIARVLQEALHVGDRFFIIGDEGGHPTIYSVSHHGGYPRLVLRVTRGDAVAYARRSAREVDQHLLAEWWLTMLRDVIGVAFLNEAPRSTASADASGSLEELRAQLWAGGRTESVSPGRIMAAGAALSPEMRHALRTLAFTVPPEFSGLPDAEHGEPEGR